MISTILILVLVNVLVGLGPLFIKFLPSLSPFSITFVRFFISALLELVIIIVLYIRLYFQFKNKDCVLDFRTIVKQSLKNYYGGKNSQFLKGRSQLLYLAWVGFLQVGIVVPFYYLSFEYMGVVLSTITSCSIPIIVIAFINWAQKHEEMGAFKLIYLFLLVAGVITIAFSRTGNENQKLSFIGVFVLILSTIAYISYLVSVGRDSQLRVKLFDHFRVSGFPNSKKIIQTVNLLRSFLKLFGMHFFGTLCLLILSVILSFIAPNGEIGLKCHQFLYIDIKSFGSLLLNPFVLSIALICTLLPFFLQLFASMKWPRFTLSFESWNSILIVIQPLMGLYIGLIIWGEPIQSDYVIFTTIFLVISILIRYLHENSNFMLVLFTVRVINVNAKKLITFLHSIKEIDEINYSLGRYGLLIHASVRSLPRLFIIKKSLLEFPGVLEVNYYPEVAIKTDST
ncbi:hypothetical protein NEF87_004670 [Candidatus Lokiarchaeum ossiferum]|uniref:Uncharacterized protein n=1 Tax=Candidatus Lokiarchaeum ossiferum TaxID=2951803 RepID=A0ABY6HXX7_9ARCH|nr:hypothetical protein NEF87_004670 [Candidatus Lokiarchaeum sp. B-35]